MAPRSGVEATFQVILAIRAICARPKPSPHRRISKQHDRTRQRVCVRLDLFGWHAHRRAMSTTQDKLPATLRRQTITANSNPPVETELGFYFVSSSIDFSDFAPSAPDIDHLELSAPRFSANTRFVEPSAPMLTPSSSSLSSADNSNNHEPSAPMLTPTFLWSNVEWGTFA